MGATDFKRPFELHTDWAKTSLGSLLSHRDDGMNEYVVAYASCNDNKAESNYSSYEGEALAVVWAVTHYRHYLYSKSLTILTDHQLGENHAYIRMLHLQHAHIWGKSRIYPHAALKTCTYLGEITHISACCIYKMRIFGENHA